MLTPKQLFEIHGYYDEKRCILVESSYARDIMCHHPEPISFTSHEYPTMSNSNNKRVELREYRLQTGESTFTGKCDTCSKIYYN